MSDEISASLARVQASAKKLNSLCDQAADAVRNLEIFLGDECSIGLEASVLVMSEKSANGEYSLHLRYGRFSDRYRIIVSWKRGRGNNDTHKPWAECSREAKLATLPFLGHLMDIVDAEIAKQIASYEPAIASVAKWAGPRAESGGVHGKK
jgi:hypothetical protein